MEKESDSINKDFPYEKVDWIAQRIFWVMMAIFITLGLFGAFGDEGPLNKREATWNGIRVKYEKFLRVEKSVELRIYVGTPSKTNHTISFNQEYFEKVKISQVIPEPDEVYMGNEKIIYKFNSLSQGAVIFFLDPLKMGWTKFELAVNEENLRTNQFIYF